MYIQHFTIFSVVFPQPGRPPCLYNPHPIGVTFFSRWAGTCTHLLWAVYTATSYVCRALVAAARRASSSSTSAGLPEAEGCSLRTRWPPSSVGDIQWPAGRGGGGEGLGRVCKK